MSEQELTVLKERAQTLLDDGIVFFRQDIESNLRLVAEVERLRKALEYYADAEKYEDSIVTAYGYTAPIVYDEGETAREALK